MPIRLVTEAPGNAAETAEPELDTTDLAALFRRFAPYVARIGGRMLGNPDDVDDLVQDVFLDAQRGLRHLRDPAAVRFWLARIAVRKAKRRLRRRALLRTFGLDNPADPAIMSDGRNVEDRAGLLAVYRVLDGIAAQDRIAWVLHRVEGESLDRIAEMCGCSRATAHRRVRAAQLALEEGLGDGAV